MNKEQFIQETEKLGIKIDDDKLNKLEKYYDLLIKTNNNINLTKITKKEDVYLKHFYDSLTLIKAIDLNRNLSLCDIGTGAGFPGLVLKIVFPTLNVTLVDALDKRVKFLNEVIEVLNLTNIKTIHSRIEELNFIEKFDIVVSRAVAYTPTLLELGCQLPKVNGYFALMKGNITEEIKDSENSIKILNYQINNILSFQLPFEESIRNIIFLKKIAKTKTIYPRKYSIIKKKNL